MEQASFHGPPRRSETVQQQEYEARILEDHYPAKQVQQDLEEHSLAQTDKEVRLPGQFPVQELGRGGVKSKLKSFWNKTVVPAFPEAVGDVSLIKKSMRVEDKVMAELQDASLHPEVARTADVRRGLVLCAEEKEWLSARKLKIRSAFCRYMDLIEADVHVDDVPVIGFGGSGGGYRAMIGMMAYAIQMKQSGLWDLLSYVAGVSGACWSLGAYYTWGDASWDAVLKHITQRLNPYHPLSPEAVREVLHSVNGPALTLGPLIQKHKSNLETVAMDLYSVFTSGHLFLGSNNGDGQIGAGPTTDHQATNTQSSWLKWSRAVRHLEQGQEPLPLLTAIRHERPWKEWADEAHPFKNADPHDEEHTAAVNAWFQWYELSPFEIGCDELGAWCPTWGFGRPFDKGRSTLQLPEQSLSLLLGLCTSAPAGPLTSYLATIKRNLPPNFLGSSILDMSRGVARMWGKQGKEEFQSRHPLSACNEHNFMLNLSKDSPQEKDAAPIERTPHIHLIDSGMDNNCPTYVLLHPSRGVDLILNMDASSDVQKDSFQERVDQIGSRRGLKYTKRDPTLKPLEDEKDPDRFQGLYGQVYDGSLLSARPAKVIDSYGHEVDNPPAPQVTQASSMVYLPLLPNERAVPGYDPSTAKFSGSYNLVWTAEQVDMLVKVSKANCQAAEDAIKTVLKEIYERKKLNREGHARK
jgi:cytosolic phospholipase A2